MGLLWAAGGDIRSYLFLCFLGCRPLNGLVGLGRYRYNGTGWKECSRVLSLKKKLWEPEGWREGVGRRIYPFCDDSGGGCAEERLDMLYHHKGR